MRQINLACVFLWPGPWHKEELAEDDEKSVRNKILCEGNVIRGSEAAQTNSSHCAYRANSRREQFHDQIRG
jgi:hypothetical protein